MSYNRLYRQPSNNAATAGSLSGFPIKSNGITGGLGHHSARWVSLWSAATRLRMVRKAATSRRTPHLAS